MHPWVRFLTGLISGCWIGVVVGCAVTLVMVGKRMRQLQNTNLVLRLKLRSRAKPRPTGTAGSGPLLVFPLREMNRPASAPMAKVASGGR
ncbi:MAG TPA: hypothetical protein VMD25_03465 [Acidobacteriaceae bacterium]|nr:hypothetical protein [Acidobacteriaceae bacterium]